MARHGTRGVCQFRGGNKYCADKQVKHSKLNKKIKRTALWHALCWQYTQHHIKVVSSFKIAFSTKPLIVYWDDNELKTEHLVKNANYICYNALTPLTIMLANSIALSRHSAYALICRLRSFNLNELNYV